MAASGLIADPRTHPPAVRQELERVAHLFRQAHRLSRAGQVADWTALKLTMAQVKVLFLLHHEGPLRAGRIAATLDVKLPTITSTVDALVDHGLVQREHDAEDRRLVIIRLTDQGSALIERLQQGRQARLIALLEQMTPQEIAALEHGLQAIVRVAGATADPPATVGGCPSREGAAP
jgi:DNA-binding MarR family transcriptional regulator